MSFPWRYLEKEKEWCILAGYRGSIAHGTYSPETDPVGFDDKDAMLFLVPPPALYLGLRDFGSRGTKEIKRDEWDIVCYEAKKAISLLAGGNPNVLGMLWLRNQDYILNSEAGDYLVGEREAFVGRHAYRAFSGYAYGQLHRMTHGQWYTGYMGQKRKSLVERHGYDTKNASHLIRLLKMGIEFLNSGELYVFRHDAPMLLEIKRGEWPLERVEEEADRLFKEAERAYSESKLPEKPDPERINKICETVIRVGWEELHGYYLARQAGT